MRLRGVKRCERFLFSAAELLVEYVVEKLCLTPFRSLFYFALRSRVGLFAGERFSWSFEGETECGLKIAAWLLRVSIPEGAGIFFVAVNCLPLGEALNPR